MIRRTIAEVLAKHKLNPTTREVYVEGSFDQRIVRWYLNMRNLRDIAVIPIDLIDVPTAVLAKYELTPGNKAEVIALAREIEKSPLGIGPQLLCVVDADCDRILTTDYASNLVALTDYTCMEMYVVEPTALTKFFQVVLGDDSVEVGPFLAKFSNVLKELFLIRAANEALGLNLRWISFSKALKCEAGTVSLDYREFSRMLCGASGAMGRIEDLNGGVEKFRPRLDPDIRHHAHGHDMIELLYFQCRNQARKNNLPNQEAISSALRACLNTDYLDTQPLFKRVRSLASAQTPAVT